MSDNLSELKKYIDDSVESYNIIKESKDPEVIKTEAFTIYANLVDLEDELKHVRRMMRKVFKKVGVTDAAVKAWANQPVEKKEETKE